MIEIYYYRDPDTQLVLLLTGAYPMSDKTVSVNGFC